jgi:hypothetical protein
MKALQLFAVQMTVAIEYVETDPIRDTVRCARGGVLQDLALDVSTARVV